MGGGILSCYIHNAFLFKYQWANFNVLRIAVDFLQPYNHHFSYLPYPIISYSINPSCGVSWISFISRCVVVKSLTFFTDVIIPSGIRFVLQKISLESLEICVNYKVKTIFPFRSPTGYTKEIIRWKEICRLFLFFSGQRTTLPLKPSMLMGKLCQGLIVLQVRMKLL